MRPTHPDEGDRPGVPSCEGSAGIWGAPIRRGTTKRRCGRAERNRHHPGGSRVRDRICPQPNALRFVLAPYPSSACRTACPECAKGGEPGAEALRRPRAAAEARGRTDDGRVRRRPGRHHDCCLHGARGRGRRASAWFTSFRAFRAHRTGTPTTDMGPTKTKGVGCGAGVGSRTREPPGWCLPSSRRGRASSLSPDVIGAPRCRPIPHRGQTIPPGRRPHPQLR